MTLVNKISSILRRDIFKNILWLSFDKIFRLLLSLIVGSAVARYLGPGDWGKINYVLAYVSIAVTVVTMGLDGFLIKGLLENPDKKNKLLGTAFVLRFVLVIISFLIIIILFWFLQLQSQYYIIFAFLFLTVVVSPFDLIDIEYQSTLKSKKSTQAKGVAYVVGSVLKILAIFTKMSVVVFALIFGIEAVFTYLLLIRKYHGKEGNLLMWKFEKGVVKYLFKNAWPFLLSAVSVIIYMRIDQIMLGNLLSIEKVGEFTAAVRVTEIFLFIPIAITGSFYSSLLNSRKEGINYELKVQKLFNIMFLISFVIAIGITLFSNLIIYVLYGSGFPESSSILKIHVWSLVAVFLGVAGNQYLVIENLQRFTFYSTFLGLVTNVVLNIFFIPAWGGKGAAYATVISYSLSACISNVFFKRSRTVLRYQLNSFFFIFKSPSLLNDIKNGI